MGETPLHGPLAKLGMFVIIIPNIFCANELSSGWGFDLGLSHAALYAIAITSGVIGGALIGGRYFLAGMLAGALASLGALWAETIYLAAVSVSYNYVFALVGMLGALPGLGVGAGIITLQRKLNDNPIPAPK